MLMLIILLTDFSINFAYQVGIGNGSIAISNVFLSSCFIFLASKEAGCIDENGLTPCNTRVHGFLPTTFVTNIAAISGLLSAFLLPVIGAIIDYTRHRQTVGRIVAFLIWMIQTIQIGTFEESWFQMAILQAIVVALFEVHYALSVSYVPDIARYEVNHETMTRFNRYFFCIQYSGQMTFLTICLAISYFLKFTSIESAHLGQSLSSFVLLICYTQAWRKLPPMEGRRKLPEGKSLLLEGFRQNFRTMQRMHRNPNKTLKWFFITVIISESGGTSLLPVALSYLIRVLRYDSLDVGFTFLLAVIFAVPGAILNSSLSRRWSPKASLRINFVCLFLVTLSAPFVLLSDAPHVVGYIWGLMWGFCLGWLYSGEQLFYTLCVPAAQEAELAGFFVYCTVVLTWLPSLIYSTIVENGGKDQYGLVPLCLLQLLAMVTIAMIPEWDDVLEGSKQKLFESGSSRDLSDEGKDPATAAVIQPLDASSKGEETQDC
jgi:UMF1 family MFS transporter